MNDNAVGSPHLVSLLGNGVTTFVHRSATLMDFGNVQVGYTSAPQPLVIRNDGNSDLTIGLLDLRSAASEVFFTVDRTDCPLNTVIPPGGSRSLSITFRPPYPAATR